MVVMWIIKFTKNAEKDKKLIAFLSSVRKLNESRKHKITGSVGVYSVYKLNCI